MKTTLMQSMGINTPAGGAKILLRCKTLGSIARFP